MRPSQIFSKIFLALIHATMSWSSAKKILLKICDRRTDGRTDGRMDGRTDGRTDRPTNGSTEKWLIESRRTRLKNIFKVAFYSSGPFACAMVKLVVLSYLTWTGSKVACSRHLLVQWSFFDAFALIMSMLINKLQLYFITKKTLNFKVLKLMLEICWLGWSMISI